MGPEVTDAPLVWLPPPVLVVVVVFVSSESESESSMQMTSISSSGSCSLDPFVALSLPAGSEACGDGEEGTNDGWVVGTLGGGVAVADVVLFAAFAVEDTSDDGGGSVLVLSDTSSVSVGFAGGAAGFDGGRESASDLAPSAPI